MSNQHYTQPTRFNDQQLASLTQQIKAIGKTLGFESISISDIDLSKSEQQLKIWLEKKFHASMNYMKKHGLKRTRPQLLVERTLRVITVRMNYLNESMDHANDVLQNDQLGYISRYALGRDYHKTIRQRLQKLAHKIEEKVGKFNYRVFCDSAPVMEKPLAIKSGQGWMGKHTNILNSESGSWFFLGEIYTDLPLPTDKPTSSHCGSCTACIDICPTQAIVAPYILDAGRCISYLTIEHQGSIPVEFRKAIGNRIYGCDDCQLVCPWNRYAKISTELDFQPRHQLNKPDLIDLFSWDETTFDRKTEGSAIRRIGYHRWLRNVAIALGNVLSNRKTKTSNKIIAALKKKQSGSSEIVTEHVSWALQQYSPELNVDKESQPK